MNSKLHYKSDLEGVTLLGPDSAQLFYTACKLSRVVAGTQAIRTMAKIMDPDDSSMATGFKDAMELACKALEEVKNSPHLQSGLVPNAAEQVERELQASRDVLCGEIDTYRTYRTIFQLNIINGTLPSRIAFLRKVICDWLITTLAQAQESNCSQPGGPAK